MKSSLLHSKLGSAKPNLKDVHDSGRDGQPGVGVKLTGKAAAVRTLFNDIVQQQGLDTDGTMATLKEPIVLYHAAESKNVASIEKSGLWPRGGRVFLGDKATCARFRANQENAVIFEVTVPAGTEIFDTGFETDEIFVKEPLSQIKKTAAPDYKRYYHVSRNSGLQPGTILTPEQGSYSPYFKVQDDLIEKFRPKDRLPRPQSVFMSDNVQDAEHWKALGSGGYVYEVQPLGRVERNNVDWFEVLRDLEDPDPSTMGLGENPSKEDIEAFYNRAAQSYWTVVSPKDRMEYRAPEYRAPKAKVIRMVAGDAKTGAITDHQFGKDQHPVRQYAQRVANANPAIEGVYLIGSTAADGQGGDIDLLYDFGHVGLPDEAEETIEMLLDAQAEMDFDSYDTFVKADDRYFHLSMGAGRGIVENTEYAKAQSGKPMVKLAANHEWTLEAAQKFVNSLPLQEAGYRAKIVGSVASTGSSRHDLDILLIPTVAEFDWEKLLLYFDSIGAWGQPTYGPSYVDDNEEEEIWEVHLKDGRVVDFFFNESGGHTAAITASRRLKRDKNGFYVCVCGYHLLIETTAPCDKQGIWDMDAIDVGVYRFCMYCGAIIEWKSKRLIGKKSDNYRLFASAKLAWQEIAINEKRRGKLVGDLLGGILEDNDDLREWAQQRGVTNLRGYMRLFRNKKMAVIDQMDAYIRGKGYGTKMLLNLIAQAKAAGCDGILLEAGVFGQQEPGFNLVEWYQKHGFKEVGKSGWVSGGKPEISLPLMVKWLKPPKKLASDRWQRIKRDFAAGIVYHGTTLEIADIIMREGFRGLEWDEIVKDVLQKYNMTLEDVPKKWRKIMDSTGRSYSHEYHMVSTTPAGEVATRFAGQGGEVAAQIEAYINKQVSVRKVKTRIAGEPVVIQCRIKNFESTESYAQVQRWFAGMERLAQEGGINGNFTLDRAADDLWTDYSNFLSAPEQLEPIRIIRGAALELLKQGPLPEGKLARKFAKLAAEEIKPSTNASTQINLPQELAYKIQQIARKVIDPADLMGDGFENESHITVKYGVEENEDGLIEAIQDIEPFEVTFGKTHTFEPGESSEGAAPVVIEIDAPELHDLHQLIADKIGNRADDFEYKAHATLAYVKPEAAKKYDGLDIFEGVVFRVENITLSKKDRLQITVPFGKTAARGEDTSSLSFNADIEGFPPVVVVRFPQQGLRWRQILKIIKQIAASVSGVRVPWRNIHIFESPWGSYTEQQETFPQWAQAQKCIMYDILPDGTFQSVGKPPTLHEPEAHFQTVTAAVTETITGNSDYWTCVCGNNWFKRGFWPCDKHGQNLDAMDEALETLGVADRRQKYYRCAECGRYFNRNSMKVLGLIPPQEGLDFTEPEVWDTPRTAAEKIKKIDGEWQCICGNTSSDNGFYSCDTSGQEVEPTPEAWDGKHYVCMECSRIIDMKTLRVVGREQGTLFGGEKMSAEDKDAATTMKSFPDALVEIPAPNSLVGAIRIEEQDLAGVGIEDEPHITLRYGVKQENIPQLREYFAGVHPFTVTLGRTEVFSPSALMGGSPLVVKVNSPELKKINADISQAQPMPFTPHVTMGYIRPEAASKYRGLDTLEGTTLPVYYVVVSDEKKQKTKIPFATHTASHKVTPLDDTMYESGEIGQETNAYANIPERTEGMQMVPRLEELASDLFKSAGEAYPASFVSDYVSKIHKGTPLQGFKTYHQQKIMRHPLWVLRRIDIMSLKPEDRQECQKLTTVEYKPEGVAQSDAEICKSYAQRQGEFPPVVADSKGHLIDGYHRIGAAILRGESSIMAYVPAPQNKKSKLTPSKRVHGSGWLLTDGRYFECSPNEMHGALAVRLGIAEEESDYEESDQFEDEMNEQALSAGHVRVISSEFEGMVDDADTRQLIADGIRRSAHTEVAIEFRRQVEGYGWAYERGLSRTAALQWMETGIRPGFDKNASTIPTLEDAIYWGLKEDYRTANGDVLSQVYWSEELNRMPDEQAEAACRAQIEKLWAQATAIMRSWQFPLTLYRGMGADSIGQIRTDEPWHAGDDAPKGMGQAWAYSEDSEYIQGLEKQGTGPNNQGETVVIVRGEIQSDAVDWDSTAYHLLVWVEEREVTLRPGATVRITGWRHANEKTWQEPPEHLRSVTAAYAEAQNQSRHTKHTPYGMYKTPKSDPFAEEWDLFGDKEEPEPKPASKPDNRPNKQLKSLIASSTSEQGTGEWAKYTIQYTTYNLEYIQWVVQKFINRMEIRRLDRHKTTLDEESGEIVQQQQIVPRPPFRIARTENAIVPLAKIKATEATIRSNYENVKQEIPNSTFMRAIAVLKFPRSNRFYIGDGNHRYQACKNLGFTTIPCVIHHIEWVAPEPEKTASSAIKFPTYEEVMDQSTDTNNEFMLEADPDLYEETKQFWTAQQFPLKVYRALALKEGQKVNRRDPGISWSLREHKALEVAHELFPDRDDYQVLEALVQPQDIDWLNTFRCWMTPMSEDEVRLKPHARPKLAGDLYRSLNHQQFENPPFEAPGKLYHTSPVENREAILKNGLCKEESEAWKMGGGGAVFMSTKPGDYNMQSPLLDVWEVDTHGLKLELDQTTEWDDDDPWWLTWGNIPPERLKLVPRAGKTANAKPIYKDVEGAPFKIGMTVRYVNPQDKEEAEELGTVGYLGHAGILEYYEYSCGCGQTYPNDPMIGVRFPDGELHEFWADELKSAEGKMAAKNYDRLARKRFPLGTIENERIYIMTNGDILSCDDDDHRGVQAFYKKGLEDGDAIVQFMNDTGAIRAGIYDGAFFIHSGVKPPNAAQLNKLMKAANYWSPSVTRAWQIATPQGVKNLPEFATPGQIRRELLAAYGQDAVEMNL